MTAARPPQQPSSQVNALDIAVIAVLLLSGLFALMRGFVHEVLSVTAWVGAALATLYGLPLARPLARQYIEADWLADIAAGAGIFLVTLIVLSLLTNMLARRVRDSALNSLDRSLGFVFGLVRGAVLVSLAYILALWLSAPGDPPAWITEAKTRPMIEGGARLLQAAVPEEYGQAEAATRSAADEARRVREAEKAFRELARPSAGEPTASPLPYYGKAERQQLDLLIQRNQ